MSGPESRRIDAVLGLHREVLNGGRLALLDSLVSTDYVSHTPRQRNSPQLAAGLAALRQRLSRAERLPNEVPRVIADGDFVYAHVKYSTLLPAAGVDIYRFGADERIAEHWSVRQPIGAHGDDERFGPAAGPALHLDPLWLKARVRTMLEELWKKGDAARVPEFYAEGYIQHNPEMPGGYGRIVEVVRQSIRSYIDRTGGLYPIEIHHLGAGGDLVFAHLGIFMAGINRNDDVRSTNVDIFRVGRDGRMIEHWDVLQMENEKADDASYF